MYILYVCVRPYALVFLYKVSCTSDCAVLKQIEWMITPSPPPSLTWHMLLHAEENEVLFTYSVEWVKSDVAWASRWDTYLRMSDVLVSWNHCPSHPSVEDFHN